MLQDALHRLLNAERDDAIYSVLADSLMYDGPAFGITPETVQMHVIERSRQFQTLFPLLEPICQTRLGWHTLPLEPLWRLWLPLAQQISAQQRNLGRPYIQGILGLQGTGKTTLAVLLAEILTQMGHRVAQLSLDDLYLTYAERMALQQVDPRFRWRGPPGTHAVDLGLEVLRQVHAGVSAPIALPRFDKSLHGGAGDRTTPEWVQDVDILLFEGWFVGVRPIDAASFDTAPWPIETDNDRQFARDINQRLHDYLPLWDQLDSLMVLYPDDYRLSLEWRRQAERQMAASGRSAMADAEIDPFVEYFWRSLHPMLYVEPLLHDAEHVEWVIRVKGDRSLDRIERL
jgi:D-glycerate 3-kinase